jgi:hypothetical protein
VSTNTQFGHVEVIIVCNTPYQEHWMSYTVIHGQFVSGTSNPSHTVRRQQNAGTLQFKPQSCVQPDGTFRSTIAGEFGLQLGAGGVVEVRLEAVDALETQYLGQRQHVQLTEGARVRVQQLLGIGTRETKDVAPGVGYLLARNVDRAGRLIAFAFSGSCDTPNGSRLFVQPRHVAASVNAALLREGWVYAACYDSLPAELRAELLELSRRARGKNLGLWPRAVALTGRPLAVPMAAALDGCVMFPKLFRRLVEYFAEGHVNLRDFPRWLRMNPHRDEMLLLPNQEVGHIHDVVEVAGDQIRMTRNAEEFIILKTSTAPLGRAQRTADEAPIRIIAAVVDPTTQDADRKTVTLLNTTANSIGLESFTLRDRVGRALGLRGDLGPGEARRFRLGHLLLGTDRGFGLSLLNGDKLVDHVAFSPREGRQPGASLVF